MQRLASICAEHCINVVQVYQTIDCTIICTIINMILTYSTSSTANRK